MKAAAGFLAILAGFVGMLVFALSKPAAPPPAHGYQLRPGDILFHGTGGAQADAIRAATDSPYTHCGIVVEKDGALQVLEAIQPVRLTTVDAFAARSLPGTFRALRPADSPDESALGEGIDWGFRQLGKNYDSHFHWSDAAIYCSELVWKIYRDAGLELCEPRPFRSYRLDHPAVKTIIGQRYGGTDKLPLDEPAVAPGDLADSPLLVEVPRTAEAER